MAHPTKKDKPHEQIKNTARGTKSMKANKRRPKVWNKELRKLVTA